MKQALLVLSCGLAMMLGSCVPFGLAVRHGLEANPAYSAAMGLGSEFVTPPVTVNPDALVQVAVRLDVTTEAVKPGTGDDEGGYVAQYRFPVTYSVEDLEGRTLAKQDTEISWRHGSHTITKRAVGPRGGVMTVETGFAKFHVESPGQLRVHIRVASDEVYGASARRVKLIVYDHVHNHGTLLIVGGVLAATGLLVVLLGAVLLVVHAARRPDAPVVSSTPPSNSMPAATLDEQQSRNWAMACHLSALAGYLVPLGGLIGPLLVWLIHRDRHPFVDEQGKEAVNFRLTLYLYYTVAFALVFVLLGIVLLALLVLFDLIFVIVAGVRAGNGEHFRYPLTIRWLR